MGSPADPHREPPHAARSEVAEVTYSSPPSRWTIRDGMTHERDEEPPRRLTPLERRVRDAHDRLDEAQNALLAALLVADPAQARRLLEARERLEATRAVLNGVYEPPEPPPDWRIYGVTR